MKVLIDGVPVNNPGGAFDFASLTTDNLDRIEVVRGPASVAYGSDAVAGVIQLFTRRGTGPVTRASPIFAEARSAPSKVKAASPAVTRWSATRSAHRARQTDGFLPFNNDFRNQVASGRLTFTPTKTTVDLTGRWNNATYHFPTDGSGAVVDSNSVREDHRSVLGLDATHRLTSRVDLRLLGAASRLDGASSNAPDSPGDSTSFYGNDDSRIERRSADLRTDVRAGGSATVSLGADIEREQVRSRSESQFGTFPASTTTFSKHRTNKAVYAQAIGTASRLTYTLSGRVDETATYGTFTTGRASVAMQVAQNTSLRAAVGNAFKAPAFEETFSTAFTIGNADLDPERTTSWELSAEQRIAGRAVATATYFDQRFRDLIQYVDGDESTQFLGTYRNLGAATARGLELEVRAPAIGRFDLGANATFLRTRVTDAGNGAFGTFVDGERLLRRPDQTAAFSVDYRATSRSRVGAAVRFVGERDDRDFTDNVRVDAAVVHAAGSEWRMGVVLIGAVAHAGDAHGPHRERVEQGVSARVRFQCARPGGAGRCEGGTWWAVAARSYLSSCLLSERMLWSSTCSTIWKRRAFFGWPRERRAYSRYSPAAPGGRRADTGAPSICSRQAPLRST